jgi:hypothetical protein
MCSGKKQIIAYTQDNFDMRVISMMNTMRARLSSARLVGFKPNAPTDPNSPAPQRRSAAAKIGKSTIFIGAPNSIAVNQGVGTSVSTIFINDTNSPTNIIVDVSDTYGVLTVAGSGATVSGNNSNSITISGGNQGAINAILSQLTIDLSGPLFDSLNVFAIDNFGEAGTTRTVVTFVSCFLTGTQITTPHGATAVETLKIGDLVRTLSGDNRQIRWIGTRRYIQPFLNANPGVQPIRISAGALGDGLPVRDLLLSPDHAVFLDGHLIPALHLVNGVSIVRETGLAEIEYIHVQLNSHDVILAEGAPCETFLENGNLATFSNSATYPQDQAAGLPCAPRITQGPILEPIWQRLLNLAKSNYSTAA